MTDELARRRHLDLLEFLGSNIGIGGEQRAILESFLDAWRLTSGEKNGSRSIVQRSTKRVRHART